MYVGSKVHYIGKEAIVLVWTEDEILIFIKNGCVKWVNKSSVIVPQIA